MDRSNLSRILLAVLVFLGVYLVFNKGCGKEKGPNTNLVIDGTVEAPLPAGDLAAPCTVETNEYKAIVGGKAGGLLSYELKGEKYVEEGKPIDLAKRTTVDVSGNPIFDYAPLRTSFRNDPGAETQVPGDIVDFHAEKKGEACVLTHVTPGLVEITRVVRPGARPYEVDFETTVKNLAKEPRKHAFATTLYALQFKHQEGGMFSRPAPNAIFKAGCSANAKADFHDKGSLREWKISTGNVDFAAITSNFLGEAIVPTDSLGAHCAVVAQDRGAPGSTSEQSLFRSAIAYQQRELAPEGSVTYRQTAFMGPKERSLLGAAAGGRHLDELIELGMFSIIAKQLVRYLSFMHGIMGSWGIAIILLTLTVRVALLPLTLPQIKSSLAMRRLKPEIDALNAKFEHDAQAKMLATSQLYKKAGVNPLAGCLPAVLQMPVWFALYTALQTAMELYHEKFFLWHDLSAPDPRFILPLVLGATMFVQQKVTPMQMDPAQQKIFLYFMPAMFTVFMLFLPAGLGVYMLTNSILGIAQTLAVEKVYQKSGPVTGADVKVVQVDDKPSKKEPRPARELARKGD